MKKLYLALVLILSAAACAFSEVTVSPDNPQIVYNGRISWRNPKSPAFSYPGTSAEFRFSGSSVTMLAKPGSAREKFTYDTENHYYTFAARTARALGAEYNVVARSGIGMYRNYGGPAEGTPDDCLPALYDRTLFYDADEKWDFSSFQPDVVCVNLGTNDMSVNKGDSVRYENAALQFAKRLRGYYPNAKIVMLTGSMLTDRNLGIVQRALNRVAAAMRKDGDNAFFRFDMSPQDGSLGYGAGYHPSMRQAEKMANELTCYLESITGWKQ